MSSPSRVRGFSIVEMMMASLGVAVLAIATYKILVSTTGLQTKEMASQTQNKQAIAAFRQIEADLRSVDPAWGQRGVPAVFPAPLLGPEGNPGSADGTLPASIANPSDALTILVKKPGNSSLYQMTGVATPIPWAIEKNGATEANFAKNDAGTQGGTKVTLVPATPALKVGDMVLVHTPSEWVLLQVSEYDGFTKTYTFQNLSKNLRQTLRTDGAQTGYVVTKEGPALASFAATGSETESGDMSTDVSFASASTIIQPVQFVNYRVIPKTFNGVAGNYLTRTVISKEADLANDPEILMKVDNVRFAFDVLQAASQGNVLTESSTSGTLNGLVFENVGFQVSNETFAVDPAESPFDLRYFFTGKPNEDTDLIRGMNRIVAVSAVATTTDTGGKQRTYNVKTSIGNTLLRHTDPKGDANITFSSAMPNRVHTGTPLFVKYNFCSPDSVSCDMDGDMLIPAAQFLDVNGNYCPAPPAPCVLSSERTEGYIRVTDALGDSKGEFTFIPDLIDDTANGQTIRRVFLPNQVVKTPDSDKTVVAGFYFEKYEYENGDPPKYDRIPAVAVIDRDGKKIRDLFKSVQQIPCAIDGSTCKVHRLGSAAPGTLYDTAGGIHFSPAGTDVYVASFTKENSSTPMYIQRAKITPDFSSINWDSAVEVPGTGPTALNQTVGAISGETVTVDGKKYLSVCLPNYQNGVNGLNWEPTSKVTYTGAIKLVPIRADGSLDGGNIVTVANTNAPYCRNSVQIGDNLYTGGRLTIQGITGQQLRDAIAKTAQPVKLATDEVYGVAPDVNNGGSHLFYARAFFVDPGSLTIPGQAKGFKNMINFIPGFGAEQIDSIHYTLFMGNEAVRKDKKPPYALQVDRNTVLAELTVGQSNSRVIAAIRRKPQLNQSEVSAVYVSESADSSNLLLLPGSIETIRMTNKGTTKAWQRTSFPTVPKTDPTYFDQWFEAMLEQATAFSNTNNDWNDMEIDFCGTVPFTVSLPDPSPLSESTDGHCAGLITRVNP